MQQGQKFSNIFRISFRSNQETIKEALEKVVVIDGKYSIVKDSSADLGVNLKIVQFSIKLNKL